MTCTTMTMLVIHRHAWFVIKQQAQLVQRLKSTMHTRKNVRLIFPLHVIPQENRFMQIIGTHNGAFHCDEALAVFLLLHTTKYRDSGECNHQRTSLDSCPSTPYTFRCKAQ